LIRVAQSQEYCVASSNPIDKAAAAFKKEEMRREGEKNLAAYRQAQIDEQRKIERLRTLRLAHEAGIAASQSELIDGDEPARPAKKKKPAKKTAKRAKRTH
jgi:hypothetical protein